MLFIHRKTFVTSLILILVLLAGMTGGMPVRVYAQTAKTPLAVPESLITGSDNSQAMFGYSVNSAGDVNGDGFDDVIIGARDYWGYQAGEVGEGAASLYLGSSSGEFIKPIWLVQANQGSAAMGQSVDTAGDVNGDGYDDVVVGAHQYSLGEQTEGAAFAYYGSQSGLDTTPDWTGQADQANSAYGWSVSSAGDVNNDGFDDVIVGARSYEGGQTDEGKAFLYLGSATGLASAPAWSKELDLENAGFGYSVSEAGDVNGDDYDDVLITSYNYIYGQLNGGKAYLFLGEAGGLGATASWIGDSGSSMDGYGHAGASAGDVNGDGYSDILVGAPAGDNGSVEGKAYLYLGSATGPSLQPDWIAQEGTQDTLFGSSLASAGDYNHDGYDDILVGDPTYSLSGAIAGAVFLYLGGSSGPDTSPRASYTSSVNNSAYALAVGSAGRFNGDLYDDFLVGAPLWTADPYGGGRVQMVFGRQGCSGNNVVTVMNTNDSGAGSLRQAVADVCPGGIINFSSLLSGETISLGSNLVLEKDLILDGSGTVPQLVISGGNIAHLEVVSGTSVTISRLTIADGNYGGILSNGNLTVLNSTLRDNFNVMGGAVSNFNGYLSIGNSTITQNEAAYGGGAIYVGGTNRARIVNSTITQNQAGHNGGGIVLNESATVEIINSTFAQNSAPNGSEISIMRETSHLTLYNSLFVCSPTNVNCYNYSPSSVTSADSILGVGTLDDFGLGPLMDNGGEQMLTMALLPGSPAIDAGGMTAACTDTDQRGVTRPQGARCDIGAFEYVDFPPLVVSSVRQNANPSNRTTVFYLVTFSEPVTGVDVMDFALNTTGAMSGAFISSVTGSGATRSVAVNTGTGDGTLRLDVVANGTIQDATGNILGFGFSSGEEYTIDKSGPTLVSSVRQNSNPTNRATVFYLVTFSEPVTGVNLTDFILTTTGNVSGASIISVAGSGATRTVSVNTGSGSGTLRLDVVDDDTVRDAAGNLLSGGFTSGQEYTVDKAAPTVVSSVRLNGNPTNRTTVFFRVTFSEVVTGVNAADFVLTTTGISGASIASVTGSGATRTISVNTGTGDGTLRLDVLDDDTIRDAAGNPSSGTFVTGQSYIINKP